MVDDRPLVGIRVLELAGGIPAAFCGRMLRGFGADTVRVERVGGVDGIGDELDDDQRVYLLSGTRRVELASRAHLQVLLDRTDVVIDDHGPRLLTELGLGPGPGSEDRPDRIVASLSPFGLTGPRAHWRTSDAVQFALGGLQSLTGEDHRPPLVTGGAQARFLGGLHGFAATAVALLGRARTGRGGLVEVSLQEAAASMPELYGPMSEYETGAPVLRSGNSPRAMWGVYRCVDGFAGVCCLERQAPALLALLGEELGEEIASDPRFIDPLQREEHDDELLAHVMVFMLGHTKDELLALGPVHRVPFGAVRTPRELLDDASFAQRGFFDRIDTPDGAAVVPGRPFPALGWVGPTRCSEVEPLDTAAVGAIWADARPGPGPAAAPVPAAATVAPLDGLRVIDLTMMWAGPYATKLLAEAGADVIKVESPTAWDNVRTLVPQDESIPDPWNSAYYFNEYNHSKRSLTLDLATEPGRQVLFRLVAGADVVIENYRADVLDGLGLGYGVLRQARDDIVLVSMAGFGKTGPLAHHVGFGPIIEMLAGLMSLTGYGDDDVPYKTGISYGDPVGGLHAVAAVALAVADRDRTGRGRHVDLAQREAVAVLAGPAFVAASLRDETPVHHGNRHPVHAPQGCYPAAAEPAGAEGDQEDRVVADAWVMITVTDDDGWRRLAGLIGRADLADLDVGQRRERHDELDEALSAWTRGRSATAAAEAVQAVGVAAGEVLDTLAIHDDVHLTARGFWRTVPNEKMRPYRQSGPTWTLHGARPHRMIRSPWFGEHNREILTDLGLTAAELDALAIAGVIADAPVSPGVG